MLKPLLKKQFWEAAAFFRLDRKNGRRRSPVVMIAFAALMLYAFGAVVMMFWYMTETLCAPLVNGGLTWVYFAFMGTVATGFSCVGSVFAAKSKLFEAKDNELLLSMPLRPWEILLSRMLGLYVLAFAFEALVFAPAAVRYFVVVGFEILPAICMLIIAFVLPLGALAISALLGWLIALATSRIRQKNLVTLLFSVAFLALYFFLYGKMNDYLTYVALHGEAVGATMKTALFPFWQMGLGATGKPLALLVFVGVFLALFALVYWLLSVTFLRLATARRGGASLKYRERAARVSSTFCALLRRECMRFFKNPMLVLNAALGGVFLLVLPVVALFNLDVCRQLAAVREIEGFLALLLGAVVCGVAAMNLITASSVSLEGETMWQLQSMPVRTWEVFAGKIALHLSVTAIPALVCTVTLCILLKISFLLSALCTLGVLAFVLFAAVGGLAIDLKMPNLHWTNEVVAVKQSRSALTAMFAGVGAVGLLVGGYFLFGKYLPVWGYLCICIVFLSCATLLLGWWLKARGTKIFARL